MRYLVEKLVRNLAWIAPSNNRMRKIAVAVALALPVVSCSNATTVSCPEHIENPRPVFLLDHGRHRTLVLTDQSGDLIRYGYGDWRYYAEAKRGFWSGARALLWPTRASLGRQEYEVDTPTPQAVESAVRVGILTTHPFEATSHAVDTLHRNLDQLFREGAKQQLVVSDFRDFELVPHPRAYWFGYNSNHAVDDWLEALGCEFDR